MGAMYESPGGDRIVLGVDCHVWELGLRGWHAHGGTRRYKRYMLIPDVTDARDAPATPRRRAGHREAGIFS
jgi:hypothetical protein